MASNIINTDGSWDLKYTTTGAVTVGALVQSGNFVGVAVESATGSGQVIAVKMECEARLTKKAAASTNLAIGGPVAMLATGGVNKVLASAATGDTIIGYATAAAATGATTATVRLIYPQVLKGALFA
jgi:predicted RecA/RadA family phage recombinase